MGGAHRVSRITPALIVLVLAAIAPVRVVAQEAPQPGSADDARQEWERNLPVGRAVRVISSEEIWRSGARNLPELLQREAGVWMTFATYAGGTPIVRGLTGNDVLIVLDGLEINNTAYRFGPREYLSTIDLHLLERIEIVRGAAGAYGGSTHGPVIRLFTKRDAAPLAAGDDSPEGPTARTHFRYSTVDKATIAHLEAQQEGEHYSFLFAATSRDFGDLRAGGQASFQRPTAYEETSGNTRLQYFVSDRQTLDLDVQVAEQTNVSQFNRLESGSHIVYRLNPRKREQFRISYLDSTPRSWSQRLEASVSLNQQRQKAYQQTALVPEEAVQSSDNNDSESVLLRFESAVGEHHSLTWGLERVEEKIGAVRKRIDVLTGEQIERGRDPTRGGQSRERQSLWVEDRIDLLDDLAISAGVRFGSAEVSGTQATPVGVFPLEMSEDGVSGFVGLGWSVTDRVELLASFDSGFRLPGIDEVTSFTDDADFESLPSSSLEASTVDSFELGLRYQWERLRLELFIFHHELDRLAVLAPAEVDGLSFRDINGNRVQDPGEPSWARTASIGASEIDGLDIDLGLELPWNLDLSASYRASEGDDHRTMTPLASQPPDFGRLGIRWQGPWKWAPWAEAVVRWAGDVTRLSETDLANPDFDPAWLEAFDVFEFRAGVTVPPRLRFLLVLENPADEEYKRFGSAIAGPGRNLVLSAEYVF